MNLVFWAIYAALSIFILVMWARLILELVQMVNREWRPRGGMLVVAEVVYTVTDGPIRLVRRVVPPLRVGGVAIDLAWSIVLIAAIVLSYVVAAFIR